MIQTADDIVTTLGDLYASEINVKISTLWDAGYDGALGDDLSGFVATGSAPTFGEAVAQLSDAAKTYFPEASSRRRMTAEPDATGTSSTSSAFSRHSSASGARVTSA
jgi:hypothetical protein